MALLRNGLLAALMLPLAPAFALDTPAASPTALPVPAAAAPAPAEPNSNFSFTRYRADYVVDADAGNQQEEHVDILLKTRSAVDQFSQVRLSYSEKMEELEVLQAYTLTADGQRRDVPADRIYTQESYSSASAAMYADRKMRVIVFPNLAPGTRVVYSTRRIQKQPYFPGYFGLWETFSVFNQYDDAQVTLRAPARLPMTVRSRGVEGNDRPVVRDGIARWSWTYRRGDPLPAQNWTAAAWEFSPTIMASTYADWPQIAKAYQLKAGPAAVVTPALRALADEVTAGISDRRQQADALYRWVARNIRYVAVYLGNGGLEPNAAQDVLDNHYGDCKDHVVILEALLAAKGIDSTAVLIGAGGGPTLPVVPTLGRFNHAITYIPEFDLYLDSTSAWARPGQLPEGDLGAPVLLTGTASVARTPANDEQRNAMGFDAEFVFGLDGSLRGHTTLQPGDSAEINIRASFARLNAQNRARAEASMVAGSGFDGQGQLQLLGDPADLTQPFNYRLDFSATDYVDFNLVGGMQLPDPPGAESFRAAYAATSAPDNATPFQCEASMREETYRVRLPDGVPVIAVPQDLHYGNAAGQYSVRWQREGQLITARHTLRQHAVRGPQALCEPGDYAGFRELYQHVRRGFRGQIVYGRVPSQAPR